MQEIRGRTRDLDSQVPPREAPGRPSSEPSQNGRETDRVVREAVENLQQRPDRDPQTGRFVPGNLAAWRGGQRSEALWGALADAKAELVERLRGDLAVDGDAPATLDGLLDGFAEASLLRRSLFVRLTEMGGPITSKGRSRALFGVYLQTLDRERRLALDLGLERRQRSVSLAEALAEAAEREADR